EIGIGRAEGAITYTPPGDFQNAHGNDGYVQQYLLALVTSANPAIQPETSRSRTAGFVFEPDPRCSVSLDWYSIRKDGVISSFIAAPALDAYFAGQPLPAGYSILVDVADPAFPNAPPRPLIVTSPFVNANSLKTDGVDLDLRVRFDFARAGALTSALEVT